MSEPRSYAGLSAAERRGARRSALIAAATRVYGEVGYNRATVRAICREAGLTERYFYESFDDQQALLAAAFEEASLGLGEIMRSALVGHDNPAERLEAVLHSYYARLREDGAGARVFLSEILGISPAIDALYHAAMSNLADGLLEILPALGDAPRLARMGLAGSIVQIALVWIRSGYREPIDSVVNAAALPFAQWLSGKLDCKV